MRGVKRRDNRAKVLGLEGGALGRKSPSVALVFSAVLFALFSGGWLSAWSAQNPAAVNSPASIVPAPSSVSIPGPLRSFLRMAGISQQVSPGEVLPLVARNVTVRGFRSGKPTEYLLLMRKYMEQAGQLTLLAGSEAVLRVSDCQQARPLLRALGYRLKAECGPNASLETDDPGLAFLTVDSGFPLADLEEALRGGNAFAYPYASSKVPAVLEVRDWTALAGFKTQNPTLLDAILQDPEVARLYWDFGRMDRETAAGLQQAPGLRGLLPYAGTLDFYGEEISIRSGKVVVPGGEAATAAWAKLVGASPDSPGQFVRALLSKDNGLLAAYFDGLSRIHRSKQAYFVDQRRIKPFYDAFRGEGVAKAEKSTFVPYPGLLLLLSRLEVDANGVAEIPGNVEVWKEIARRKGTSRIDRTWASRAERWTNPEQVVEGMFAYAREFPQQGPLQLYLMLNELDHSSAESRRLSPETVRLLADRFARFGDQYLIFSEFSALDNGAITRFLNVAQSVDRIRDPLLRADALGILQANIGLWQILARQGEIRSADWSDSWQRVINPLANVASATQLFDAGQASLSELMRAASGKAHISQDEFIALLAGPAPNSPDGERIRQFLANRIHTVLDDQRLVSLDTIFAVADGFTGKTQAAPVPAGLVERAAELRAFELPRPLFTSEERTQFSAGLFNNRHAAAELQFDAAKILKSQLPVKDYVAARGQLAPFLRDTLVGLNYAYYEPPGAQMIHNNPLFVRAQDFSGQMSLQGAQAWQVPQLSGRGWSASGGGHLAGSLAELPYVLAQVEEDFIVPAHLQALIWEDLVPTILTNATLPRWWNVSPEELHAVALYQKTGEELLTAAAKDAELRTKVMGILDDSMLPQTAAEVEDALAAGRVQDALAETTPEATFGLAAEFRRDFPDDQSHWGPNGKELDELVKRMPSDADGERVAKDFGVPHPNLASSYRRELLNTKPMPAYAGFASQLLAESWESNNLYWARLADEMGYSPVMLNRLVPELTYHMVEEISASHFDDWPALLRAMRETGDEFRNGKFASLQNISLQNKGNVSAP